MLFDPLGLCIASATHSRTRSSGTGLVKSSRLRTARVVDSSSSGVSGSSGMGGHHNRAIVEVVLCLRT